MRAVVFAYHNVGYRCLSVLLAHGFDVPLVVTHDDQPGEQIWVDSVETLARRHGLPVAKPLDPNSKEIEERVQAADPHFLFSFYYRQMLGVPLLASPRHGALNMHGSLLPKFRGRVPVNWAIIHGERQTGATLHYMTDKPDAGDIVAQHAVPILPDDTALEVFHKVTVAAELALDRVLPDLIAGRATRIRQNLAEGSYFGGRTAADGRIDWRQSAQRVHDLVRAVAPPYPGAFTEAGGHRLRILRTLREPQRLQRFPTPALYCEKGRCYAQCGDGGVLRVLELEVDGRMLTDEAFSSAGDTPPVWLSVNPHSRPAP